MSSDLKAVLMNPQIDLNRFLADYVEHQSANYVLEADAVAREVIAQRDHYQDLTRTLIDRVAEVDVQEAPNLQIALLQESLEKTKDFQEKQMKTIEQNKAHLEQVQKHKVALLSSYEGYQKKLENAQPKLPCEKALYRFASAATNYIACRNTVQSYASGSKKV